MPETSAVPALNVSNASSLMTPVFTKSYIPFLTPRSLSSSDNSSPPTVSPSLSSELSSNSLTDFERCKKYLVKADKALPTGQVDANKYNALISLWTRGQIDAEKFVDLPNDLKNEF